jgi:4'-phosphopantetheinyl transferase
MAASVDIWTWSLDAAPDETDRLLAHLAPDERERAARFFAPRDSARFVVGRGRLREILADYVGEAPAALCFDYGEHGKPRLGHIGRTPPFFNLSHSHGLAVLGVCRDVPIGLDIEAVRPIKEDIADQFFSAGERQALSRLAESDQQAGFFRCWTRKEAFIKCVGHGLSLPLDSFEVELRPNAIPRLLWWHGHPKAPDEWAVCHLEPRDGWVGAVAARTSGLRLRTRQ